MSTEKFIDTAEQYSVLYDLRSKDYKNKMIKENAWSLVGSECNISAEDAKKKWKHMRDQFRRAKEKEKTKSRSAALSHKQWEWLESLRWLDDYCKFEKVSSSHCSNVGIESADERDGPSIEPTSPTPVAKKAKRSEGKLDMTISKLY